MAAIVPFDFEGAAVRITARDGTPWFVLPDVCRVLEIVNPTRAASRLDDDERGLHTVKVGGADQEVNVVNESGLYSLILTSRKPAAKRFKRWVTGEVLPAIRRTGGYMVAAPDESPMALAARALSVLQATITRQNEAAELRHMELAVLAPKADALDLLTATDGSLSITAAAKVLEVRPKDLVTYLQQNTWVYRRTGGAALLGYSAKIAAGMLTHKVTTVTRGDGSEKMVEQVLITSKGLARLAGLLKPGARA